MFLVGSGLKWGLCLTINKGKKDNEMKIKPKFQIFMDIECLFPLM